MTKHRTILIGLDGATFTVLDALMAQGRMPNLRRIVENGARADLLSTANPLTPPAWTSLVTGRTPGHHGIFDFIHAADGDGGLYFTLNTSFDIRCETIWSMVSRLGGSITSLNFPVTAPPRPVNGYVVPGFVPWRHLRRSVHPREFYDVMKAIPGFDARELAMDMNEELKSIQWLPDEEHEPWIRHHIKRERQWHAILRSILKDRPTDLVAVLFDGVDKLQHLFWRSIDPALNEGPQPPQIEKIRGWCLEYFASLDVLLGEILAAAGPEARVFFASDHGFGPTTDVFYANVWLEQRGHLAWTEGTPTDDWGRNATDKIKSHVVGIDWTKTRAYALTPSSNGIFIRRARRPGEPGVADGEYETFRAGLARDLLAFKHPKTGRNVVRRVMTREEAFPGPSSDRAPDLTLVLDDYGFLSVLKSDVAVRPRPDTAGTHRPEGIFMAYGPGIARGRRLQPLSIVDVAPALLHSLGLPIPSDLEGRVPVECYEDAALRSLPVLTGPATLPPDAETEAPAGEQMSDEDEAKVMERLRALGYVE